MRRNIWVHTTSWHGDIFSACTWTNMTTKGWCTIMSNIFSAKMGWTSEGGNMRQWQQAKKMDKKRISDMIHSNHRECYDNSGNWGIWTVMSDHIRHMWCFPSCGAGRGCNYALERGICWNVGDDMLFWHQKEKSYYRFIWKKPCMGCCTVRCYFTYV